MQTESSNHVHSGTSPGTYSVAEAARLLGVSPNTVRARCKSGALHCERALRPQGEVIRVYLDVLDVQHPPVASRAAARAQDVQAGTSTGTYSDQLHVPTELQRADALATALRPLIEAAIDPLRAELAEVRRLLSVRDQELGHLRAEFEALQADSLEIPLQRESDEAGVGPTQMPSTTPRSEPWWRFWRA